MKMTSTLKCLMIAATIGITFTACRKDKDEDKDADTSAAADNALAEGTYNDVVNISDQAASGSLNTYMTTENSSGMEQRDFMSACATITNDTISVPHILTIDFGPTNCLCTDARSRRGQIIVSYSGHYRDAGSTHTITFNNYYVNDNKIMGTKTVLNNGLNSSGHSTFSITVNGQIQKAAGGTITWTSNRTREWIVGESTSTWSDDVYLITGSASGTSAAGISFTLNITSALRREIGCRHFVSGSFALTPSGKATRYVDYGTGGCDNSATVTINGNVYNITLP
ncbi:MAG: hypothetical protein JWP12_3029 [Bacteroidetes bacterium]|nr:hypothetical protein [Bacteroidota bacterium]